MRLSKVLVKYTLQRDTCQIINGLIFQEKSNISSSFTWSITSEARYILICSVTSWTIQHHSCDSTLTCIHYFRSYPRQLSTHLFHDFRSHPARSAHEGVPHRVPGQIFACGQPGRHAKIWKCLISCEILWHVQCRAKSHIHEEKLYFWAIKWQQIIP